MAQPRVVGAVGGGGVAESGAGVENDAAGGGCCLLGLGPDLRLPALRNLTFQARREVLAGFSDLVLHVPLDGSLGDLQQLRDCPGALELLDQVPHLGPADLGMGRVNAPCTALSSPSPTVTIGLPLSLLSGVLGAVLADLGVSDKAGDLATHSLARPRHLAYHPSVGVEPVTSPIDGQRRAGKPMSSRRDES